MWDEESGTEAVQRDAGVVDDEVDALGVRLLQVFCKIFDAGIVCDVQVMVLDLCEAAVRLQRFGLLQLRVLVELLDRGFTPALITGREVDDEWTIVERRFWIL